MSARTIAGTVIMGALLVTLALIPFNKPTEPPRQRRPKGPPPSRLHTTDTEVGGRKKYTRRV